MECLSRVYKSEASIECRLYELVSKGINLFLKGLTKLLFSPNNSKSMPLDCGVRHKLWIGSLVNCIATIQSLFGGLSLREYKIVTDETKTKLSLIV